MRFPLLALALSLAMLACSPESDPSTPPAITPGQGYWQLSIGTDSTLFHIDAFVGSTGEFTFYNGEEEVHTADSRIHGDSIEFRISPYPSWFRGVLKDSSLLTGVWTDEMRPAYSMPFTARLQPTERPEYPTMIGNSDGFKVTFNPGSDNAYEAQGLFTRYTGPCTGTFLTETGDYRYLAGHRTLDKIQLYTFDGAHLFSFEADIASDSLINGVFRSGKHYSSTWEAHADDFFRLRDPLDITYLTDSTSEAFTFQARDKTGKDKTFGPQDFEQSLTIVQAFGSWCPNCLDENRFYKELHEQYADKGLQIIPVAFERGDDLAAITSQLTKQFDEIGIAYPYYLGGPDSKTHASEVFSAVNQIISFPTSIFVNSSGEVVRIHTGFYGPGTGKAYDDYVRETTSFIENELEALR